MERLLHAWQQRCEVLAISDSEYGSKRVRHDLGAGCFGFMDNDNQIVNRFCTITITEERKSAVFGHTHVWVKREVAGIEN